MPGNYWGDPRSENLVYPIGTYLWYMEDLYYLSDIGAMVWLDTEDRWDIEDEDFGAVEYDAFLWNLIQSGDFPERMRVVTCPVKISKYAHMIREE